MIVGSRFAGEPALSDEVCGAGSEGSEYGSLLIFRRTTDRHDAMIID